MWKAAGYGYQGLEKPPKHTKAKNKGKRMEVRWCGVTQAQCGKDLSTFENGKEWNAETLPLYSTLHLKPQSWEAFMCFTPSQESQEFLIILIDGPHGNFLKTTDYQCKSSWLKFFMSDIDFLKSESRISHQRAVASNLACRQANNCFAEGLDPVK